MEKIQKKYRLSTAEFSVVLTYVLHELRNIEIERLESLGAIGELLIAIDEDVENIKRIGVKIEPIDEPEVNQKVAVWCELYKHRYGVAYKVSGAEAKQLKTAEITIQLINQFFECTEWWAKDKTIGKYAKYLTELKRISSGISAKGTGNRQNLADEFQRRYGH